MFAIKNYRIYIPFSLIVYALKHSVLIAPTTTGDAHEHPNPRAVDGGK